MAKIQLTKSFRLLRFLNRRPGPLLRYPLAVMGWFGAFVFTAKPVLAAEIWRSIARDRDLKRAMRRLSWYAGRSWLRLELIRDPVFDFAEGLNRAEREAVAGILARGPQDTTASYLDQLTLIAAAVQTPMKAADWDTLMAKFAHAGDALLNCIVQSEVCFVASDDARTGDFATADAAKALADFAGLFPPAMVPWYVVSGTFLGIIREGGFLKHDYDIDLGIHAEDADLPKIVSILGESDAFFLHKSDVQTILTRLPDGDMTSQSCPVLYKIVHRTGLHIDLFVHYLDGDQRWHGSNVHRWNNSTFRLVLYTLAGVDVLGPDNPDKYLRENYGDWRTPRTSFNPSTGTPNLAMVHNLASFVLFLRRYALACEAGDMGAGQLADILVDDGYLLRESKELRINPTRF